MHTFDHTILHLISHTQLHHTCHIPHTQLHHTCHVSHTQLHHTCHVSHTQLHHTCHVSHTQLHHTAVDATQFTPDPTCRPPHRLVIVTLSRLVYRKGIDLLAAIIPAVCARHPHVDFLIGMCVCKGVYVFLWVCLYMCQLKCCWWIYNNNDGGING